MDFKKTAVGFNRFPDLSPCFFIRCNRSADGYASVFCDFCGYKTNPFDIDVTVFLGKIEFRGEVSSDNIPVKKGDGSCSDFQES